MTDVTDTPLPGAEPDRDTAPALPTYRIRKIDMEAPWHWLLRGFADLRNSGYLGCVHGAWYALLGFGLTTILWLQQILYVSLPLAATFTLIGPLAAVGLYRISEDLSRGRAPRLSDSVLAWTVNPTQIALIGVALLLLALAWMRLAFMIFMLFFSDNPPRPEALFMVDVFLSADSVPFLITGIVTGGAMAAVAFALSAVSIPFLMDNPRGHVFQAIFVSLQAVRDNFWPMLLWAWLIAVFIGVGLLTAYVGLILTLPLIGHATWHAYKDLVEIRSPEEEGDAVAGDEDGRAADDGAAPA